MAWKAACPAPSHLLKSTVPKVHSHAPDPHFCNQAPVLRSGQPGVRWWGVPCKAGTTPESGYGSPPILSAELALLGRRRAWKPFEMRGAEDHWSLGVGVGAGCCPGGSTNWKKCSPLLKSPHHSGSGWVLVWREVGAFTSL